VARRPMGAATQFGVWCVESDGTTHTLSCSTSEGQVRASRPLAAHCEGYLGWVCRESLGFVNSAPSIGAAVGVRCAMGPQTNTRSMRRSRLHADPGCQAGDGAIPTSNRQACV